MTEYLQAGAATAPLEPPLGLVLFGALSQTRTGSGYGLPLEANAVVIDGAEGRVAICGVDICGINIPEIDELIGRVAEELSMDPAGVILNWSHTHQGLIGGIYGIGGDYYGYCAGPPDPERDQRTIRFGRVVQDKIVTACRLAAARLEPARLTWGAGVADLAVNRRERTTRGETILGWNPDSPVDNQVTVLQARRLDDSPIGTVVSYGCHPVTVGWGTDVYSSDFPGALRIAVRRMIGGDCVFLQASGGNVLPRFAFFDDESEAVRMGERLAIEAVHAIADRPSAPRRVRRLDSGSLMPISMYRLEADGTGCQPVAAVRTEVTFPLQDLPSLDELDEIRSEYEDRLRRAEAAGDRPGMFRAYYHAGWARDAAAAIRAGTARTSMNGWINAVRLGDGVIVTGPGETFTEIGMAVKERAPGRPTLYCGYTNGIVTYFATAAEYAHGGYEAGYGNRGTGLPAQVTADAERILVETGVRLAESLFPGSEPWPAERGFVASGSLPPIEPIPPFDYPPATETTGMRVDG